MLCILSLAGLNAGVAVNHQNTNQLNTSSQQLAAQSVAGEVLRFSSKMAEKVLDIEPTIKVKAGTKIKVFSEDLLLKPVL